MPSKNYTLIEEQILFQDSGGSAVLALQNLAAGSGRYSDRYDRGTGSKPGWARIYATIQFEATGITGETVEVYVVPWSIHSTPRAAGGLATTGAALGSDLRRNLNDGIPHLLVKTDKTTAQTDIIGFAPLVFVPGRYLSVVVWNASV